jgi:hypothetical protein
VHDAQLEGRDLEKSKVKGTVKLAEAVNEGGKELLKVTCELAYEGGRMPAPKGLPRGVKGASQTAPADWRAKRNMTVPADPAAPRPLAVSGEHTVRQTVTGTAPDGRKATVEISMETSYEERYTFDK